LSTPPRTARRGRLSPQSVVEQALALPGADDRVVLVEESTEANLRWANNTLTTNGVARGRTATVVSVVGRGAGVVSRQGLVSVDEVKEVAAAADAAARGAAPAEDAAPLVGPSASSGDWDAPSAETSIGVFDAFAPALGDSFARAAATGQLLFGFAYHEMATTYVGSSAGMRGRFDQPTGHAEINAKSPDLARSAWVGVPTQDFTDVDVAGLHSQLDRRLAWAQRRVDLPAGRYDTILPPGAVADLMIYLYWSADGRAAHEGRTVFSRPEGGTRVGDRLTDAALTLRSDPHLPGLECAPFLTAHRSGGGRSVFDNGTPLAPTSWISNGVLGSLVQTRHSARLTGSAYTPYIDNLTLETADPAGDIDHLVAGTDRGLLVTCLWYIREVDPRTLLLTGLTRDGVYLVEGGEVRAAVNNFRFNESPVAVLARAGAVGTSTPTLPREWADYFTRVSMPPVRVAGFNLSSVSPAS
jgi:predicted Zn-dependent protease